MAAMEGSANSSAGDRSRFTVAAVAERLGAEVDGPGTIVVEGLNTLDLAGPNEMSYIGSEAYAARWEVSRAAAAAVTAGVRVPGHDPRRRALLRVPDADLALAELLCLFAPRCDQPAPGIHAQASVHATASVHPTASIGPRASVGAGSTIGPRTHLEPGVQIGRDVRIGSDCILQAGVVIRDRCILHDRICIHANSVIGSDGFGYRPDGRGGVCKLPHIGIVEIHSDVEIGACTTIDRGKFGMTVIGEHTKIDNLVQIAHNVRIGRCCFLASQVGLAGTVEVGDYAQLGAKCGVADHRRVGRGARLSAMAGVAEDVPDGAEVYGAPAISRRVFWHLQASLRKLPELIKTVARLEQEHNRAGRHDAEPS